MTPKQIPTEAIVSSVEAVLSRQHELSESTKDNIRSRVTSTLQSASLPNSNLTPDEKKALKRLKTDVNIVILPAEGRVTVVMENRTSEAPLKLSNVQPYNIRVAHKPITTLRRLYEEW